ncbi:hypothetical protein GCM10010313_12780 [Streptomyces violarus]|uniref:Enamine deaminase RidA (YjgF/YER057c/UK114 family) n=1 Tax=Streptomyces violarus TaxID=67380 RepID=A0A7W4ZLR8_9ACTN|nr:MULTISPECIES: RidA family protein [Streptomyces]MBB3074814.1 enamine deaminase RidA (YjgF/YER057c/UK114 family) [Streptomyces violarus]WRT97472.1 RidA family protein [Streptomyces sp. CGMCC 4.1772]GHD00904.1 hypothetical protein GCM10010313_12780 [Streptomyces violarus]
MSELTRIPAPDGVAAAALYSKLTYFFTDMAHMPAIRAARAEHIPVDRLPAAPAVRGAGLVRPEFLMEIEAFAVVAE